jgi:hypothetical protein
VLTTYIRVPFTIPLRFSVMVGDVFHNLRSALDQLAFQLGKLELGGVEPPRRTEFPIFKDKDEFLRTTRGGGLNKIAALSQRHQALIQALQPYHRRKKALGHPLWVLHEFSNLDKHRLPSYAMPVLDEIKVTSGIGNIAVSSYKLFPGPFVDGTPIGRFFTMPTASHAVMHVEYELTVGITFDESALFKNQKLPSLLHVRDAVAAIPPLFEADF